MSGDQRELDQAIEQWFTAEVDRVWRQYESGNHSGALVPAEASPEVRKSIQREILSGDAENRLASLTEDYRNGLYASALPVTRRIVSSLSDPFDEGDQRFTAAAKKVMEALGIVEGARLEWARGNEGFQPALHVPDHHSAIETLVEKSGPSITQIAEDYLAHRKAERGTSPKMISQLRGQIDLLINELGGDTPIASVTPERAGSIYRAFRALPPDHRNLPDLSGLGLTDAARRANELGLRPMSPKTVNNRMTTYRGLFKEAQDQSVVTENPFKGKNISVSKIAGSDVGFSEDEANAIFGSSVFVGCERLGRPLQAGSYLLGSWRFWLPLVALMTGARIGELCQLRREDIVDVGDILSFSITDAADKRLKTPHSKRVVPIHDELIRLGFDEFVQRAPIRGPTGSLFGITRPGNEDWGAQAGNWFREKLLNNRLGEARRSGLGFHSFRHNVETSMREAGVRQDISHRLLGHKAADVAASYGRYEPSSAKRAVMAIKLPTSVAFIPSRRST